MKSFNEICALVESLDGEEYAAAITSNMIKVLPVLDAIAPDGEGKRALATFLVASVYADGKVNEAEYLLMKPALELCFGRDFDFESVITYIASYKKENKDLKKITDFFVDLVGTVSPELKADLVMLCLLVCAVDGKISRKEKDYILKLIKD